MTKPHMQRASSHSVQIHIAGDCQKATQFCQSFCDAKGLCVTVTETLYVYTGGREPGVRIGLINYPRFPKAPWEIDRIAFELACGLRTWLEQESFSIETATETRWYSWRDQDTSAA